MILERFVPKCKRIFENLNPHRIMMTGQNYVGEYLFGSYRLAERYPQSDYSQMILQFSTPKPPI